MRLHIHVRRLATSTMTLIQGLELDVAAGTLHTLMGPSGAGKSSLLAAVCGTLPAGLQFDGDITLDGQPIVHLPPEQRRVGILFQDDLLFAHMTVGENLLFAVPPGPRKQRQARVVQGLRDLEMQSFEQADPSTLSGGQRSRVALMRALLAEPRTLLLDEPFSKLDQALRVRMRQLVFALVRSRGIPALLVTHDAADIADAAHVTRLP